jgi:hypothetical protein
MIRLRISAFLPAVLVLMLAAAPLAAPLAAQALPQPFSADVQMKGKNRNENVSGKMYFGVTKWRMDMSTQGHQMSMIVDMPSKVAYMVMPEQRMYMEMRMDQEAPGAPRTRDLRPVDPNNPCADQEDYTCQKAGSEVVNGRSTDKWVFTDRKQRESHTVWVDQKLRFPIRSVHHDGATMDLTNIQEGAQAAALFQVPAGFQKFDMGGMMKPR